MNLSDIEWELDVLSSASHIFGPTMKEAVVNTEYIVGIARQVTDSANVDTDTLVKRLHVMLGTQGDFYTAHHYASRLGAIENLTNDEAHEALVTLVEMLKVKP